MKQFTLDEIKEEFQMLWHYGMEHRDFEQYLREQYWRVVDGNLNVTGYEPRSNT